jgi:hypothetical protein
LAAYPALWLSAMVKMKSTQVQNGTSSDFDTGFLIRRDQASIEAASTPSTLLTNSFIAATAAIMMWQPEAKASLAAWILIVAFVNLLRYLSVLIGLRLRLVERKPDAMLIILASGALVSGISWAILPVLAYFDGFLFNPTMACVISGVTAGKAVLSPVYRHAVWPFILSILASYIACLLIQQDFVSYVLAGPRRDGAGPLDREAPGRCHGGPGHRDQHGRAGLDLHRPAAAGDGDRGACGGRGRLSSIFRDAMGLAFLFAKTQEPLEMWVSDVCNLRR